MTTPDPAPTSLLLTDGDGNHYLLTPALLAQARISVAELAALTGAEVDDTGGFGFFDLGSALSSAINTPQSNSPHSTNPSDPRLSPTYLATPWPTRS
jgi:hypothetical protein